MRSAPLDSLGNAVITGSIARGLTVKTRDGKPAQLAIIDDDGNVIEAGRAVAFESWRIPLEVHTNFLRGNGHLIVSSTPAGSQDATAKVAVPETTEKQRPAHGGGMKPLINTVMRGTIWEGLTVATLNGKPARLAIINDDKRVIEAGRPVAREIWMTAIEAHTNFLINTGYLIVHTAPPGLPKPIEDAVDADSVVKPKPSGGRA